MWHMIVADLPPVSQAWGRDSGPGLPSGSPLLQNTNPEPFHPLPLADLWAKKVPR